MDHIVVDVEIQKTIEETPGGWEATDQLGVSVACVWEYSTGRMRVYGPGDLEALQKRLLQADRISGYNIYNFDFPVIWGISKAEWKIMARGGLDVATSVPVQAHWPYLPRLANRTDDLLRRIWQAAGLNPDVFTESHKGWGLDAVAKATLGVGKVGYGGDAPKWYQAGQVHRVINYCADDVALERDLTDFVDRYGYVSNGKVKLDVSGWEEVR